MLTDFLKTTQSTDHLKIALEVIQEFKSRESDSEWLSTPFVAWKRLEQLEEMLEQLIRKKEHVHEP